MASGDKCPVDHASPPPADKCPVDHGSMHSGAAEQCPVDHTARSSWTSLFSSKNDKAAPPHPQPAASSSALPRLPVDREVSSIPRTDGENWVYPSQAQFFAAMERKNHNPHAPDMKVIVPIHNAVNERAWAEVMRWEAGQGGDACGGVKLVSFKGKSKELTPRARWKTMLGYTPPFDRHDWVVDRCGTRVRYVIDFYTGRSAANNNPSFYLDVRPALDSWEGVRLRAEKFVSNWVGDLWSSSSPSPSSKPAS
ncbi:cytochrome C1 heme lyase [Phanerochaete sordida]|uniref:Holocytochrome c-type synthase n=1 Tax=Phanerochaete sordida TaxID=48140 RepID=A0A9P3L975_9APHY|nr:cytochrome C1 heme lyase [Phanerochaete sordida]